MGLRIFKLFKGKSFFYLRDKFEDKWDVLTSLAQVWNHFTSDQILTDLWNTKRVKTFSNWLMQRDYHVLKKETEKALHTCRTHLSFHIKPIQTNLIYCFGLFTSFQRLFVVIISNVVWETVSAGVQLVVSQHFLSAVRIHEQSQTKLRVASDWRTIRFKHSSSVMVMMMKDSVDEYSASRNLTP